MHRLLIVTLLTLVIAGCGGEATVTLVNNTSRYVNGTIDDSPFGLPESGEAMRTVEVGGFLKSSSEIDIVAYIHVTYEMTSPVDVRLQESIKMEADHEYRYEIFYPSYSSKPAVRLLEDNPTSMLLAP